MSRETKIGLLVGLGIIMVFALILEWRLNTAHANLGEDSQGSHLSQVVITDKDPLEANTPSSSDKVALSADAASTGVSADTLVSRNEEQGVIVVDRGSTAVRPDRVASTTAPATSLIAEPAQSDVVVAPPAEAPSYTVKAGDTGAKIAEKIFGTGQGGKWKLIAKLNPKVDPTRLKVGTKLMLPAETVEKTAEPTREATSPRDDSTTGGKQPYVVAKGDTLGTISTKVYGTSKKWQLIAAANKGVDSKTLKVGMKLTIPEAPAAAPVATPVTTPATAPAAPAPTGPSALPSDYTDTMMAGGTTPGGAAELGLGDRRSPSHTTTIASGETYKVQSGDTLAIISHKVLGSSARWKEIYDLNKSKLPNPKALTIGQELRMPAAATRVAMADTSVIR